MVVRFLVSMRLTTQLLMWQFNVDYTMIYSSNRLFLFLLSVTFEFFSSLVIGEDVMIIEIVSRFLVFHIIFCIA